MKLRKGVNLFLAQSGNEEDEHVQGGRKRILFSGEMKRRFYQDYSALKLKQAKPCLGNEAVNLSF